MAPCRFRRWAVTAVSPLLAIRLITAHFKFAKLSRQFLSRSGVHLKLTPARRGCSSTQPGFALLPRRESVPLLLSLAALISFLSIAYITLAEATPAEAAAPPIQTCSGISSYVTGPTSLTPPPVLATFTQTTPRSQTVVLSRTIPIPNPAYPDPNDPDVPEFIDGVETQEKSIYVPFVSAANSTSTAVFGAVAVPAPSPGPPDTSSNLTTQTTYMRPNVGGSGGGPTTTIDPDHNSNFAGRPGTGTTGPPFNLPETYGGGAASYSVSVSIGSFSGTRKSDGANTISSPANYYSKGTIEAWRYSANWGATVSASESYYFTNFIVIPDMSWDGGPGYIVSYRDSVNLISSASGGGTVSGCTRTLVVEPPTCTAKLRSHPDNALTSWAISGAPYATETFDPNVEHGGGGQTISVFPVGPNNSRSAFMLRNVNNLFELGTSGSSYSYSGASPYGSGRSPSASGQGRLPVASDGTLGSYLNGADWSSVTSSTLETDNSINFPGKYRVTWTPSWSSRGSSAGWNGSELSGSVCRYKGPPYANGSGTADPTEGPQSRPSDGSVVSSLTLNVHVFADPPTCTVDNFLFEVNEPIVPKVTLSNPNNAPMWVDVADSNISRLGFSQTDVSGFAGQEVPANGDLVIDPTVPSINHSGEFVLNWKIQTNMGNETWTTLGTPKPPQRSWFEDPEERIVDSAANACEVTISKVVYRPFIKVFYGSLAAGGRFGDKASYDACGENFDHVVGEDSGLSVNNSFVAGHTEGSGPSDARGSSVEYALQANNIIGGFYSASQRSSDPQPLKGLTFANNDIFHAYGGSFGRQACIANYWREVEKIDPTAKPLPPLPLELDLATELNANERRRYELPGETLKLKASANLSDLKATLYVEGDVLITEDIVNNTGRRWYDPSEIGYLSIIVQGNIDIAPSVERIDALLVAYPEVDSGGNVVNGRIRTCWDPVLADPTSPRNTHFHTCDKQLVINGALIAEKVLFGRVHASVRQEELPLQPPLPPLPPLTGVYSRVSADPCQTAKNTYPLAYPSGFPNSYTHPHYYRYYKKVYMGSPVDSVHSSNSVHSGSIQAYANGWPDPYFFNHGNPLSPQSICPNIGELLEMNVLRPGESFNTISRGQMAIFLARALNNGQDPAAPPVGTPSPFTDVDASQVWWPHVVWLANHLNVGPTVLGYDGGTSYPAAPPTSFSPNNNATRLWTAVLVSEVYNAPGQDRFIVSLNYLLITDHGNTFEDLLPLGGPSHPHYNTRYEERIRRAAHGIAQRWGAWHPTSTTQGWPHDRSVFCDIFFSFNPRTDWDGGHNYFDNYGWAGCMFRPNNHEGELLLSMLARTIRYTHDNSGGATTTTTIVAQLGGSWSVGPGGVPGNLRPDCSEIDSGRFGIAWDPPSDGGVAGYYYNVEGPGSWRKSGRTWGRDNTERVFTGVPGPGHYKVSVSSIGNIRGASSGEWICPAIVTAPALPNITAISSANLQFETHFSSINIVCGPHTGISVRPGGRRYWNSLSGFWGPSAIDVSITGPLEATTTSDYGMFDPSLYSGVFFSGLPTREGLTYRVAAADHSFRNKASISQIVTCDADGNGNPGPATVRTVPPPVVVTPPGPVPPGPYPTTTTAAEIINLLPEYFIGVPELPLFPDQIYKTDSVSTQPVNF